MSGGGGKGAVPTLRLGVAGDAGAFAATSTRAGGVSDGPLGALNLGFRAADSPGRVRENRSRFGEALRLDAGAFVVGRQVHGNVVAVVGRGDLGRGALSPETAIPGCDALVTGDAGVPLLVLSADCPVVVIADRNRPALAAAHAGWRGLLSGVLENTIDALAARLGSLPGDLAAAIAPCIGPCCYEVGDDVVAAGRAAVPDFERHLVPGRGERPHLDLRSVARAILERRGLPSDAIESSPACTRCRGEEFFSYRGSAGLCGLLGTAAVIRG